MKKIIIAIIILLTVSGCGTYDETLDTKCRADCLDKGYNYLLSGGESFGSDEFCNCIKPDGFGVNIWQRV